MQKRTVRTAAFKKKIALAAKRELETTNEISTRFNVHPMQVRKWKKEFLDNAELVFDKKNNNTHQDKEDLLHRQIGKLVVENDWLKKKLGL